MRTFAWFLCLAAASTPAAAAVTVEQRPGVIVLRNDEVSLRFDRVRGTFELSAGAVVVGDWAAEAALGSVSLTTRGASPLDYQVLPLVDALGTGYALTVGTATAPHRLEATFSLRDGERGFTARMAVVAGAATPVGRFALAAPLTSLAGLGGGLRALSEGFQSWVGPTLAEAPSALAGEGSLALWSPAFDSTLVLGAMSATERTTATIADGPRLENAGPRAPLAAGGRAASDLLAVRIAGGQNQALEAYADAVAAWGGVGPAASPDWGWSSWLSAEPDASVLEVAGAGLAALDRGLGEAVLQIDDGWQSNIGDWDADAGFPAGMAAAAARAHAQSLRAGLWIAPFLASEASRVVRDHPDWLVADGSGVPQVLFERSSWGGRIYRLDPSVPAVLDHLRGLIDTAARVWGFDLLKLDFLDAGLVEEARARPGSDPRAAFRAALAVMRSASGAGTRILLSGMPIAFAPGSGELFRVGPDVEIDAARNVPPMASSARRAHLNRAWCWGDADTVMVRAEIPASEARARVAWHAMLGGPVLLGDPFWVLPAERMAMMRRLLPPHALRGQALDVFTSELPALYRLETGAGASLESAFAWSEVTRERFLPLTRALADAAPEPVLVWDSWANRALGWFASPVAAAIAPRDVLTASVTRSGDAPWIAASHAHLAGIAVNVESATFTDPVLDVRAKGDPGGSLRLALAAPDGLAASGATGGSLRARSDGLIDLELTLDGSGRASAAVTFGAAPLPPPPPTGRPVIAAPPGVRVTGDDDIADFTALQTLLAEAAGGVLVVVLPPAAAAPVPARFASAPWAEVRVRAVPPTASANPDSLGGRFATALGLPLSDSSGVRVNLRPGLEPRPLLDGTRVRLTTHAVVPVGRGAVIRLGRMAAAATVAAVERLGDPGVRAELLAIFAEAARLEAVGRESQTLAGSWRFATDPAQSGDALGYHQPGFDDRGWAQVPVPGNWESAGFPGYDGQAWYRVQAWVPQSWDGLDLLLGLGGVDDEDETAALGVRIGAGAFWIAPRRYPIPAGGIRAGQSNLVSVRVMDRGQGGGILREAWLRPDPVAIERRLEGGDLVGFLEPSGLGAAPQPGVLVLVKEGAGVRATARGGAAPFVLERGRFPDGGGAVAIQGSPFAGRSIRDDAPPTPSAWRMVP